MALNKISRKSLLVGGLSFMIVLFAMPIGHAIMILMQHFLKGSSLFQAAFIMGGVGLLITIWGVFVNGDAKQTIMGLLGGLLFWTGWVEFVYVYYAERFGVDRLIIDGVEKSRPEYLIMPSSFGFLIMFLLLYIFSIKSGCDFFNYIQKHFFKNSKVKVELKPITHHVSIVTFMELNVMMWACYLILLFCYDNEFIGDESLFTSIFAWGCLVGSLFMFNRLIRINVWGYAIRYAIATVIVLWSFVEVMARLKMYKEIWIHPLEYKASMLAILIVFLFVLILYLINAKKIKRLH